MKENFTTTKRVGNNPEKGERHYIVLNGLTKPAAETLIALTLDVRETDGKTAVTGIQEKTWQKVMRSMEEFDGVPAFRLPSEATDADAEDVLHNIRDRFEFCMSIDPHMLESMGQRHTTN